MAMMPLMPDFDHSHLDFYDLNWCTSPSSLAGHQWINQSLMNYNSDHISNCNEHFRGGFFSNQKEIRPISSTPPELANPNSSLNQVMAQDLVLPASIQDYNDHIHKEAAARLQYTLKIKEEMSQDTLPRLYEAIREHYQIIDEKLFTRALQNSSHDLLPYAESDFTLNNELSIDRYANIPSGGNNSCNMVLPSVNTLSNSSNLHLVPLPGIQILDTDLHAFNVLAASRLNTMPFVRDDAAFGPTSALIQQLAQGTCTIQPKVPSLLTGVTGNRVNNNNNSILENKTSQSHQDIPRKSRLESRSPSCSSFKVRKEKLGDRIAALQQLVSPFGKTDTASVLMEAIGYIKFLQDQVETLSVPYLRLPKTKKQRTAQGEENESSEREKESEAKKDLRSRGLCLVPLSCTSYVTNEITASPLNTFSPPNFSFPGTI